MAWWKGGWRWGWRGSWNGPWPGNGPWSFLPPWMRPGWYLGRGYCRYLYGPGAGWYFRYYGRVPPIYYYWSVPRLPWQYWYPW